MKDDTRNDIRRALKQFGVKADEELVAYLALNSDITELNIRLTLEDITDYGKLAPENALSLVVEASIRS
jgi:hypothetical protein